MSAPSNARVVAVGASAGGVKALQSLILALPSDLGAAFVILQHLPPGKPSELPSLIARWTSMPVRVPEEGALPEPNCIYVPSPDDVLTLEQGMFRMRPVVEGGRRPGIDTIDAFVESLAQDQGSSAIAVVLSGTGMDGCAGTARVRQEGGTVFVQDPVTASFGEMPSAVVTRSLANYVLPASEIPEQLAKCLNGSDNGISAPGGSEVMRSLNAILDFIRKQVGFDLRGYKPSPILWRVQQRMDVRRVRTFDDYLALLQDSPSELETLVRRIPIHITEFFRDPETWDVLNREVLEPMVGGATEIRTWTPACATGEEAYSTAILLAER